MEFRVCCGFTKTSTFTINHELITGCLLLLQRIQREIFFQDHEKKFRNILSSRLNQFQLAQTYSFPSYFNWVLADIRATFYLQALLCGQQFYLIQHRINLIFRICKFRLNRPELISVDGINKMSYQLTYFIDRNKIQGCSENRVLTRKRNIHYS